MGGLYSEVYGIPGSRAHKRALSLTHEKFWRRLNWSKTLSQSKTEFL